MCKIHARLKIDALRGLLESTTMSLELIIGPMFAGKSSAAVARVARAKVLGWNTLIITSALDTRYSTSNSINTHDGTSIPAVKLNKLSEILTFGDFHSAKLVVIEEAQFFSDLYDMVTLAVEIHRKNVVVIGLDGDSERKPFGDILKLIPYADTITRLTALCKRCGDGSPAHFTALVEGSKDTQVCVGGSDKYEAMCRRHYIQNLKY